MCTKLMDLQIQGSIKESLSCLMLAASPGPIPSFTKSGSLGTRLLINITLAHVYKIPF